MSEVEVDNIQPEEQKGDHADKNDSEPIIEDVDPSEEPCQLEISEEIKVNPEPDS